MQEGESIESAQRRFKRKVQTDDIIKEVKRHSYYLKPEPWRESVPAKKSVGIRTELLAPECKRALRRSFVGQME